MLEALDHPFRVAAASPPAAGGTLYIASTPLHVFFALGLMQGPLGGGPQSLFLVDQRGAGADPLLDALRAQLPSVRVMRFDALDDRRATRAQLDRISALVADLAPASVAVGMDHRLEFHAALRGCPKARGVYMDDGLYSYLPYRRQRPRWYWALAGWWRRRKYGLAAERGPYVGGSRAVREAYVLLPQAVHAGLAGKPVHALQPAWFAAEAVVRVCTTAVVDAGWSAARCAGLGLLLLLPNPRWLGEGSALRAMLAALAWRHARAGHAVGLKSHPAATLPAHTQLGLPPDLASEIPRRLPVEVLAPLLAGAQVVGGPTSALLTLSLLGHALDVRCLPPTADAGAFGAGVLSLCQRAGVRLLDPAAGPTDTEPPSHG